MKNLKILQKTGVLVAVLSLSLAGSFGLQVNAAGVTPTVTPSAQAVATAGTVTLAYTASVNMPIGSTIALSYNSLYTGTLSAANTTVNTAAPSTVVNTTGGGQTTSTLTLSTAITAGGTVTIATSALTSPAAAGNYAFSISSSTGDFGANFQYVGQANVVQVRAFVPISLSFAIRNAADTANTNTCDLGTQNITTVTNCDYRLKIGTNAANGYTVSVLTSGNLTNGLKNMVNAAAGATGSALAAGTELYGATVTPGTTSAGTLTLAAPYTSAGANAVNYTNAATATLLTSTGTNNPAVTGDTTNTSLVSHKLAISSNTGGGLYTQTVTYTVVPNF